jgi:hydrogenase maturation protein HypF
VALAILYEVMGEEAFSAELPPATAFTDGELKVIRGMLRQKVNSPVTTSAGRLFDAFASLIGLRQVARFEGQAAMELEFALAGVKTDESYPFEVQTESGALTLDWAKIVTSALVDRSPQGIASARFHNTLVEMGLEVARRVGEERVVLSGGCFQNRYLTERFISRLQVAGFKAYWHQRVPPNDGGIALGQLMAATASLRKG